MHGFVTEFKGTWCRLSGTIDRGVWIEAGAVFACPYPRAESDIAALAALPIQCVINLHTKAHLPELLARFGITEHHFPTPDFQPPTPLVLDAAVKAMQQEVEAGRAVAVHCVGGLGRTGTLIACYLLQTDKEVSAAEAIQSVRALRPGAIETPAQEKAVADFATRLRGKVALNHI